MKIKIKNLLFIGFLSLVLVTSLKYGSSNNSLSPSVNAQVTTDRAIPTSIRTCVPKGVYSGYLNAKVIDGAKTYYSLIWERKVPSEIFDGEMEPIQQLTVILKDDLGCQVIVPPEKGLTHSKALFMPLPLARQLALNSWQRRIALFGSREKFQEEFDKSDPQDDAGTSPPLFFPEDKWAFDQLGLKLPKDAIVREILNDQEIINEMER